MKEKFAFKMFLGLTVLASSLLSAESLETYIKQYEPNYYKSLQRKGIPISKEVEAIETSNQVDISSPVALRSRRTKITPREAKRLCEGKKGGVFLENRYVATCISRDGTLGNGFNKLGLTFNPKGTGTVVSPDFLQPGSPFEFFAVSIDGQNYHNNNRNGGTYSPPGDMIPTKVKPLSRFSFFQNGGAIAYSSIKNLQITQEYTLDPNSRELIVRVEFQNKGKHTIKELLYARGIDPDQDRPTTFNTFNKRGGSFGYLPISPENIVQAVGLKSKLAIGLYSVDPIKHNTCVSRRWTMNPQHIFSLTGSCALSSRPIAIADSTINMAFNLGQLRADEKKVVLFKYLFEQKRKRLNPIKDYSSKR